MTETNSPGPHLGYSTRGPFVRLKSGSGISPIKTDMFISIILDPGRVWTDHAVIDTERHVRICTCSDQADADAIAKIMNIHQSERLAKALLTDKEVK